MLRLNDERERIAKENEEKGFQKYIGFYWLRKAQERELRRRTKAKNTKLKEKAEKLEELEKENEKKSKDLMAKIRRREIVKEKYDKERKKRLKLEKEKREEKMRRCNTQKKEIRKEENERILDILDYQFELLRRSQKKEKMGELRRINAGEKTIIDQMVLLTCMYQKCPVGMTPTIHMLLRPQMSLSFSFCLISYHITCLTLVLFGFALYF